MKFQHLGPYELQDVIGRGGMGTVYRALDLNEGKVVAVKVLAPIYSFDDYFRGRFELEIETLIQLNHPNIVRILSHGQEDGNLYFAMELVSGNSLFEKFKSGYPFRWPEVLMIAKQVALGLRHAHDRGVIHRDLKPGNLLVSDEDGCIKITDFGIAKRFGGTHMTGEGNLVGTLDYMAPEQFRGEQATARSDLYSLGIVTFMLLVGRVPFAGSSYEELYSQIAKQSVPRLDSINSEIPTPVADLVQQLTRRNPDKRIPTALALARKIEAVLEELQHLAEASTQVVGKDQTDLPAHRHDKIEDSPSDQIVIAEGIPNDLTRPSVKQPADNSNRSNAGPRMQPELDQADSKAIRPDTDLANQPTRIANRSNEGESGSRESAASSAPPVGGSVDDQASPPRAGASSDDWANQPTAPSASPSVSSPPASAKTEIVAAKEVEDEQELDSSSAQPSPPVATLTETASENSKPPDYFNPVTENVRRQVQRRDSESDDFSPAAGRAWPLALMLVLALGLLSYGIYHALIKRPSADQLLAIIDDQSERLYLVTEEMEDFLEWYPEHERVDEIEQWLAIGEAESYLRGLRRGRRTPPTPTATELLEIVEQADEHPGETRDRLQDFIRIHSVLELEVEDREALVAAEGYLVKVERELAREIERKIELIESSLESARELISSDPVQARELLNSVIRRFADDPDVADHLLPVRELMAEMDD